MINCICVEGPDDKMCDKPPVFGRVITSIHGARYYVEVCQKHRKEIDNEPKK